DECRRIGAGACPVAGGIDHRGVAVQPAGDANRLRSRRREGVVVEVGVVLDPDALALVVDELGVANAGDAAAGADATTLVTADHGAVDVHVAHAVVQGHASGAVVLHTAAVPAQRARLA